MIGVVCVNFLFTYPYWALNFTLAGYPVTFIGMLAISFITSAAATHMKQQMKMLAERERLLVEAEKEKCALIFSVPSPTICAPLTGIIGSGASYLENGDTLDENQKKELVRQIYEDSNWLLNMVENLLSVTRIQDGEANVNKSLESVEEVVSEAVIRLKNVCPMPKSTSAYRTNSS